MIDTPKMEICRAPSPRGAFCMMLLEHAGGHDWETGIDLGVVGGPMLVTPEALEQAGKLLTQLCGPEFPPTAGEIELAMANVGGLQLLRAILGITLDVVDEISSSYEFAAAVVIKARQMALISASMKD